jgi:hypothetical protein
VNEIFPIVSGVLVGALLPLIRPQTRLVVGILAALVLGTLATIISGEYKIGWEFLMIDIPLVALCCTASFVTARALHRRTSGDQAR